MDEKVVCRVPFRHERIHTCAHLVAYCSDFRFEKGINKLKRILGIEESDGIRIPGGTRAISDPATEQYMRDKIGLLVEAHGIENLLAINHSNCGDYAKAGFTFQAFDEELKFHSSELRKAKAKLQEWFPGIKVHSVYAQISRDRKHIEFIDVH